MMSFRGALFVCLSGAVLVQAQDGPTHVIVTYRAQPDKHASLRAGLNGAASRLSQWKDSGVIGGYAVLTNALIDDEGWESTTIVQLGGRGLELLKRLDQPDPASVASTTTVPADLIESAAGDGEAPGTGVYLVIPYESTGGGDDYKDYTKNYLVPLMNASMKEGGLMGYQLFWARFPIGRSWSALVVMHYRDWASLGQRDAVTAKVSAQLMNENAGWAASGKPGGWRERIAVIAEPAGAR